MDFQKYLYNAYIKIASITYPKKFIPLKLLTFDGPNDLLFCCLFLRNIMATFITLLMTYLEQTFIDYWYHNNRLNFLKNCDFCQFQICRFSMIMKWMMDNFCLKGVKKANWSDQRLYLKECTSKESIFRELWTKLAVQCASKMSINVYM